MRVIIVLCALFYGTTQHGGDIGKGYGTVFEMNSRGVEGVSGELYGTATGGGLSPKKSSECVSSGARIAAARYYKCGIIFGMSRTDQEHILHRFTGDPDGANPEANLTYAGGVLYGTIFRIFP